MLRNKSPDDIHPFICHCYFVYSRNVFCKKKIDKREVILELVSWCHDNDKLEGFLGHKEADKFIKPSVIR